MNLTSADAKREECKKEMFKRVADEYNSIQTRVDKLLPGERDHLTYRLERVTDRFSLKYKFFDLQLEIFEMKAAGKNPHFYRSLIEKCLMNTKKQLCNELADKGYRAYLSSDGLHMYIHWGYGFRLRALVKAIIILNRAFRAVSC